MTENNPSLPAAGGSYIRDADGSLTPADDPEAPKKSTVKGPVKAPVKER
jgi:hypothetical protein